MPVTRSQQRGRVLGAAQLLAQAETCTFLLTWQHELQNDAEQMFWLLTRVQPLLL